MALLHRVGALDVDDSALALSAAPGVLKAATVPAHPPAAAEQQSEAQGQPLQQQPAQGAHQPSRHPFSGHLMLMDMESNSTLTTPSPPGSPSSGRAPGSGIGGSAVQLQAQSGQAPALDMQVPDAALNPEGQAAAAEAGDRTSPARPPAAPFTPPSDYVDRADRTLFFARVSSTASAEEVSAAFRPCGEVEEVNLFRAWPTAKASKGCGLVVMATAAGAAKAILALDRQLTWEGADGPMVVERCDPARLGIKAANAAACKAVRAAAAAAAAAARRKPAGATAPLPGAHRSVRHGAGTAAPGPQALYLLPAGLDAEAAGRGYSAPLLALARDAPSTLLQRPPSERAQSGPLMMLPPGAQIASAVPATGYAAPQAGCSSSSIATSALPYGVADVCGAFAGLSVSGQSSSSGPLHFLPMETLPASFDGLPPWTGAVPPVPRTAPDDGHANSGQIASGRSVASTASSLASRRDQLLEEMAAIERERRAMEAASNMLMQQQQELELMLMHQQGPPSGGGTAGAPAAAMGFQDPSVRGAAQAPLAQLAQGPTQQLALPISQADLATIRSHAPTVALLSGATLSVDAGAAEAATLGRLPPEQQLWLLVSGTPPQLQSASTLISRLVGGYGCSL